MDHTPFSLQLVYRVCRGEGDNEEEFSPHTPHYHTFPPLPLSAHSFLLVSVTTLPRLLQIPEELTSHPTRDISLQPKPHLHNNQKSKGQGSNELKRSKDQGSNEIKVSRGQGSSEIRGLNCAAPMPFGVERLAKASPKEGFPFSPPLPSPLSPKLLTGLDMSPFDPTPNPTDRSVNSLEKALQHFNLDSAPVPVKVEHSGGRGGGGCVVPPSASSPAPFSRMHTSEGVRRGGAKRRSCAIACKVRNLT